jgi:hypothetical protein
MRRSATLALLLAAACQSSKWDQYPGSLYTVLREETPAAVRAHRDLLGGLLDEAERGGRRPPPGMSAEFAYYCWLLGARDEARAAIDRERALYPESARFLEVLERFLPSLTVVDGGEGGS